MQEPTPNAPREEGENQPQALSQTPEKARRERKKTEVGEKYGDDNLEMVSEKKTREVLANPAKLKQFLFEQSGMERGQQGMMKPEHIVRQMLDTVKSDTAFLKKVIEAYADRVDSEYGYICVNAIEIIDLVDDEFFKELFEKHNHPKALTKVQDQDYLKSIVKNVSSEGRISTLEAITDQSFLSSIALDDMEDLPLRLIAISRVNDKTVLQKIADMTDQEVEKIGLSGGMLRNDARYYLFREQMDKLQTQRNDQSDFNPVPTSQQMEMLNSGYPNVAGTIIESTQDPDVAQYLLEHPNLIEEYVTTRFAPSVEQKAIDEYIELSRDRLEEIATR